MPHSDDDIKNALTQLERAISNRVRVEQLSDQLTRLSNGAALAESIRDSLAQRRDFWIAFIEVDRFKSINDRFGYDNADALLFKIADTLRNACNFFRGATQAFRAHGDEFYLMGVFDQTGDPELDQKVGGSLELVRQNIAHIKVIVEKRSEPMSCTVSVGWLSTLEVGKDEVLTDRTIMTRLESAVAEAKWTRNRVERFRGDLAKDDAVTLRAECGTCRTKFALDVKRSENRKAERLRCPNCGAEVERPVAPSIAPRVPQQAI